MTIKNEQERNDAINILQEGMKTPFWKLIVEALEDSREDIQEKQDGADVSGLSADEYRLTMELWKAKKVFLVMLKKTPENLILWLQKPGGEEGGKKEDNFDPYDKA